jgi:hypothetical protein
VIGWLSRLLIGWSEGQLVGQWVDWFLFRSFGYLVERWAGIMVSWSVVRMVGVSLVGPLTDRSIVWSGCCLLVGMVGCLIGGFVCL